MNDPQYVEACRVLAEKLVRDHPHDAASIIGESFRLWTARVPKPEEAAVLQKLLEDERGWFSGHEADAEALCSRNGESLSDRSLDPVEIAAVTVLERALLGDDETLVEQ
jgi:hypothetical protein